MQTSLLALLSQLLSHPSVSIGIHSKSPCGYQNPWLLMSLKTKWQNGAVQWIQSALHSCRFASCSVTNHVTFRVCWRLATVHQLFGSYTKSKAVPYTAVFMCNCIASLRDQSMWHFTKTDRKKSKQPTVMKVQRRNKKWWCCEGNLHWKHVELYKG